MNHSTLRTGIRHTVLLIAIGVLAVAQSSAMTWRWSNPTPHGNNIYDMAWNGYLTVQVGDRGQLYTAVNFLGWTPQNSGTTNDLEAVTFLGNRIVIVGANGTVGYSDDGINFTTTNLNTTNWLVGVAASPNLLVAVGDNAVIYTSPDGANWSYQGQAPSNPDGDWLLSVAWGAGVFVATGEGGYVATSNNGTNWTRSPRQITADLTRVAYISTTNTSYNFPYTAFWAVAYNGLAFYSLDGSAWGRFTGILSTNAFWTVTANDTTGLLAGDSDVRLGTTASTWSKQTDPLLTQGSPAPVWAYYAALWDTTNCAYRLAGDDGMMVQGTPTNGVFAWQIQYDSPHDLLWQVTVADGLYVAVGENARIMTSDDGGDWNIEAIPLTNSVSSSNTVFLCIGGSTNLLIAAGTGGSLSVSPNVLTQVVITNLDGTLSTNLASFLGVLWDSLPAPTTNDLAAVCAFKNSFFLAGGNATLLRSANGTNWAQVPLPPAVGTTDLSGLAGSTNLLVAVGDQGMILTSSDGTTWTQQASHTSNGLLHVRCLCGVFLVVGENGTILKSTNGLSWSSMASGTTNWLNDAVIISNTCYIVGNNGTVLASTNLTDWTSMGCITSQSLYGAATQNGQLIVVGLQGTILRSQVVPNLTSPVFFYDYAQASTSNMLYNIFYVSGYPDQLFTLDTSTNLINWTTGPLLDFIYGSGTLTFITSLGTNPVPRQFYRATLAP
jgi:hypothetical protein